MFCEIFRPGYIGTLKIKNRVVMAPIGISMQEPDGRFMHRAIPYFEERAKGGVGLIVTGMSTPAPWIEPPKGWDLIPRVDVSYVIPRLTDLAERVHDYGTKVMIQLTAGFGRVLPRPFLESKQVVSASSGTAFWDKSVLVRELSTEEVEHLVDSFGKAAELIERAGFDGIELHGHEGYLMDQFTSGIWNVRKDKYGGSLEKRMSFVTGIIKRIRERVERTFPIIYRYGVTHGIEGGRTIEEGLEVAKLLVAEGVDALHVDKGCYENWYWPHPPEYQPPGCMTELAEKVKGVVDVPVITVGRLGDPEIVNRVLQEGKADFVALGRPLLADPFWIEKVRKGKLEEIRPCIGCHEGCLKRIFENKPISCAVNPQCGNEKELTIIPTRKKRKVMVVGGGIAGMEAARVAKLKGHNVDLYEKQEQLGGHLIAAGVPEFKKDLKHLRNYLVNQIRNLGIEINLGLQVTKELIISEKPDILIIATGSRYIIPEIQGIHRKSVYTATDILNQDPGALGDKGIVIGGGMIGSETALHFSSKGKKVVLIEALDEIAKDLFEPNQMMVNELLKEYGVQVHIQTKVNKITSEGVKTVNLEGREALFKGDFIVTACGLEPRNELRKELTSYDLEVHAIGDCVQPGKVIDAMWQAYRTSRLL